MRKLKLVGVVMIGATLSLGGCAAVDQQATRKVEGLGAVHIGMTTSQVRGLIGSPDRLGGIRLTAAGTETCWLYAESSFMSMGWNLGAGLVTASGGPVTGYGIIKLMFQNDKLTSKEFIN
jgi:hypothetical protein